MEYLGCVVERITYQNWKSGFTVLQCGVKGYHELVTAVGIMPEVHVGSVLRLGGSWKVDAKYGRQFAAETFEETLPATVYGIEKYLGSGLIKGIGPKNASKIVKAFGEDTLRVIEEEPERLLSVSGIGRARVQRIKSSWDEQQEIRNIIVFLQGKDVSTSHATKIFKTYGNDSIRVVTENPYRLADDIWGIGFKTADTIAEKMGFGKERFERLRSGLLYTMNRLSEDGHCYATREMLIRAGTELLRVEDVRLRDALTEVIRCQDLITQEIPRAPSENVTDGSPLYQISRNTGTGAGTGIAAGSGAGTTAGASTSTTAGTFTGTSVSTAAGASAAKGNAAFGNAAIGNAANSGAVSRNAADGSVVSGNAANSNAIRDDSLNRNAASGNISTGNSISRNAANCGTASGNFAVGNAANSGAVFRNAADGSVVSGNAANGSAVYGNAAFSNALAAVDSVTDETAIYLPTFYFAEKGVARRLREILAGETAYSDQVCDAALQKAASVLQYDDTQLRAIRTALCSKIMILTGGPGTGKTTTTLGILTAFQSLGARLLLAAPTGRAAKRLTETTGMEAKTIHRLLETKPPDGYQRNADHPLQGDVLIVDECSMIDLMLMYNLLKAVPDSMQLILVGDVDQLPSVGAGNVLRDLIDSGVFPTVRLTRIFRQAQTSRIITNAHRINQGQQPDLSNGKDTDFFFMERPEPEQAVETIVELVCRKLPQYYEIAPQAIQVLTPMQRGAVGAARLNEVLQKALNPQSDGMGRGGYYFKSGDKVMQIRNNYEKEVFNGDIGRVVRLDFSEKTLTALFDDREVVYDVTELDELTLSYATTIHKSQGSEYPVVIIPLMMSHFVMLQRNLVYTGVTRAKKGLVIVGQKKALRYAVNQASAQKRNTLLKERLRNTIPDPPDGYDTPSIFQ